jgi:hypothetical protein
MQWDPSPASDIFPESIFNRTGAEVQFMLDRMYRQTLGAERLDLCREFVCQQGASSIMNTLDDGFRDAEPLGDFSVGNPTSGEPSHLGRVSPFGTMSGAQPKILPNAPGSHL